MLSRERIKVGTENQHLTSWQFNEIFLVGIGLGIVRALCNQKGGIVYLTARDENRGLDSVELLEKVSFAEYYFNIYNFQPSSDCFL